MTDVSQVDTNISFEPRTPPVNPAGVNTPDRAPEPSFGERDEAAFSVDISADAQQLSAGGSAAPETPGSQGEIGQNVGSESPAGFDTTFETSATDGIDPSDGSGSNTNQVTSFEDERTGNSSRNTSEANRTLGQVVDTFA